jgi:hypothetical protein
MREAAIVGGQLLYHREHRGERSSRTMSARNQWPPGTPP